MPSLDLFRTSNAFSMMEMTASINRAAFAPGRIGAFGLFEKDGIRTTDMALERKGNTIALIPSKPRGGKATQHERDKRAVRKFAVPHCPYDDTIKADDVQNVRAFGSENELEAVSDVVNDCLDSMRQDHEITHEWYRAGAIQGVVKDGDGSTTLIDLFSEFGISQTAVDFVLGTAGTNVKGLTESVRRVIETALGSLAYTGIHAFVGNTFWDKLINHAEVKLAYERWLGNGGQGAFLRETQNAVPGASRGFEFAGVTWENYRGKVGSNEFIPLTDARFVPLGVKGLFIERYAPADMMETVNTKGLPVYAVQELQRFNKGVDIHTQSNAICLCTIPDVLVRGHTSN